MSILRFKTKFDDGVENNILVTALVVDSDTFPFLEDDIIALNFQLATIEPGSFVYETELQNAIWTIELFPEVESLESTWFEGSLEKGEFIEHNATRFVSKATLLNDDRSYDLEVPVDRNNLLLGHLIEGDPDFPFDLSDRVTLHLRITNLTRDIRSNMKSVGSKEGEEITVWEMNLAPVGKRIDDTIVSSLRV